MSLTRTSTGLANEHLFYGVDYVFYVEGGSARNITDVLAGNYDNSSDDIRFWSSICAVFLPNHRCKFKAVGGKSVLLEIASRLRVIARSSTILAVDRDYDLQKGNLQNDPFVIYTHGYSWENDVWQVEVVEKIFSLYCPGCPIEIDVNPEIQAWFSQLARDLRWPIYADFVLLMRNQSYRGIRGSVGRVLYFDSDRVPTINTRQLRTDFKASIPSAKARAASHQIPSKFTSPRDCFGHFLDSVMNLFVSAILKARCHRRVNLAPEIIHAAAVDALRQLLQSGSPSHLHAHYQTQFARL